jgi:hypothetical protein
MEEKAEVVAFIINAHNVVEDDFVTFVGYAGC